MKTVSKSAYKRQRNACSNCAPLERTVLLTRSVIKKQSRNKSIVPVLHCLEGNAVPAGYCHTNAHYAGGVGANYFNSWRRQLIN